MLCEFRLLTTAHIQIMDFTEHCCWTNGYAQLDSSCSLRRTAFPIDQRRMGAHVRGHHRGGWILLGERR